MNRLWWWIGVAFLSVAPFWYGAVIWYDLTHPELWDNWLHDPRVYLPMFGVVLILAGLLALHIVWTEVRERRERKSRHP